VIGIGSVVNGKYQLSRLLGDGGMGSVYEARHTVLGTRVAIKVLHPELARRPGLVERFLQEARVAAQIRSAHVVQVTDVDRTPEGHAYIVMELLEGEPLSAVLDRQRRLPVPTACEYTLQILEALEAAHALGVIHRDLKPENVFLTFAAGKPVLKLIDFGIAKARRTDPTQKNLTVAGVVMGTAEYMAPEQARSAGEVDARADLYAVGVMLYEMISGARPVTGDDARVIALKVERGEGIPLVQVAPDVPREIAGLVHRAMAARPELRFATATDMRLALEKAAAGKRPATGQAQAQVQGAAPVPEMTSTGTLKNVSAQQVLAGGGAGTAQRAPAGATPVGPMQVPGGDGEAPPHTERSPPVGTAMTPPTPGYAGAPATPGYAGVAIPPPQYADARKRGGAGAGRVVAMIALPLLLGAGIVMVLIATGQWSPGAEPTSPTTSWANQTGDAGTGSQPTSPTGPIAPPTVATVPTSPTPPGIPTLAPTGRVPGGPTGRPNPSSRPPHGAPDAGGNANPSAGPTQIFPPTFPPFALPSGLPPLFPPWPGTPPPPQQGQGPAPGPGSPPGSSGSI
jgi:serine/threonine-protein kinase